jgi:hypothetical protein
MIAASSGVSGNCSDPPAHTAPRRRAKSCAAMSPDRCAEAVDPEPLGATRHHQRSPTDQAGAQQGCDRNIVAAFAERKRVARIGDGMGGIATVARVSGKERTITEIFHPSLQYRQTPQVYPSMESRPGHRPDAS